VYAEQPLIHAGTKPSASLDIVPSADHARIARALRLNDRALPDALLDAFVSGLVQRLALRRVGTVEAEGFATTVLRTLVASHAAFHGIFAWRQPRAGHGSRGNTLAQRRRSAREG
jgi:hypothetical protein